jgi:hypothetical protein
MAGPVQNVIIIGAGNNRKMSLNNTFSKTTLIPKASLAYPQHTICLASHLAWPSISLTLRPRSSPLPLAKRAVFSLVIGFGGLPRPSELYPLTCTDNSPRSTMARDGGDTVPAQRSRFPGLAYLLMARRAKTGFAKGPVQAQLLLLCSLGGLRQEEMLLPPSPTSHLRQPPLHKCALLRLTEHHSIPNHVTEIRWSYANSCSTNAAPATSMSTIP